MTSVAKDRTLVRHHPVNKITKIQILGCKNFLLSSLNYLDIVIYSHSSICVLLFIFILLIISYCIIIHPRICIFVILLSGWCGTRVRPARLVSYALLYTTQDHLSRTNAVCVPFSKSVILPHTLKACSLIFLR